MYEDSGSFRDDVELQRWGLNPSLALQWGERTRLVADVEHFEEDRTTDRGIPSWAVANADGDRLPVDVDRSLFFGSPRDSVSRVDVDAFNLFVEHDFGDGVQLRNRLRYADYDKFYQNIFANGPAIFDPVSNRYELRLAGYNSGAERRNLFNQTDLEIRLDGGAVKHTLLAGVEFGRQRSDNVRLTARFASNDCFGSQTTASFCVPLDDPRFDGTAIFYQSATDADNHVDTAIAAAYVQDQIEFSPRWQALIGLRYDRFAIDFDNHRNGSTLRHTDNLLSPRLGLVFKPRDDMSLYASYGMTYLPRSGEQMASLSTSNAAFDPEEYENREIGLKWDIRPDLAFTAAVLRLDRRNVLVPDLNNPALSVLVDGDRIEGLEVGLAGNLTENWRVMGGAAWQDGEIRIRGVDTGKRPSNLAELTASLWNRYDFNERWGVGVGVVHRGSVFASTGNAVRLPAFTRFDAALYFNPGEHIELQLNLENLTDKHYYSTAHNDNNISPGAPRAAWLSLRLNY
jgi:catecholate siderophore receptor